GLQHRARIAQCELRKLALRDVVDGADRADHRAGARIANGTGRPVEPLLLTGRGVHEYFTALRLSTRQPTTPGLEDRAPGRIDELVAFFRSAEFLDRTAIQFGGAIAHPHTLETAVRVKAILESVSGQHGSRRPPAPL